jgi:dipeptidyl aminopeptidase/acylaminoacyl peptidase
MSRLIRAAAFAVLVATPLASLLASPLIAQQGVAGQGAVQQGSWNPSEVLKAEGWARPPAVVERIITTPRTDISFSSPAPDRGWFLRTVSDDRTTVAVFGQPHVKLGGLQVDAAASRARSLTASRGRGLMLINPQTGATRTLQVPGGASISGATWSPAGTQVAFIANFATASHVYVADVATGRSTQVTRTPLLATLVTSVEWTADGSRLVAVLVPAGRGAEPTHGPNNVEDGPQVRLTGGRVIPQRIHASLLADPHDKALLAWHTTGQLAVIDVRTRAVRTVGRPAMIRSVDASPDGQHFRVTRLVEPFSYLVPVSSFGSVEELWDASGTVLSTLARTPLREGERDTTAGPGARAGGAGRAGGPGAAGGGQATAADTARRSLQWNPVGRGLVYLQAAPAANGQPAGVRYVNWLPPFGAGDTTVVYRGSARLTSVAYAVDGRTMFVADSGLVIAVRVADPSSRHSLGAGVALPGGGGGAGGGRGGGAATAPDTVGTGGTLQMRRGPNGQQMVMVGDGGASVFVAGTRVPGAAWNTRGPRPWLDRLDIQSGRRTRLLDSPADAYQEFVVALDDDFAQFIYTSESPTVIADAHLRDTRAGTTRQLTANRDVAPEVTGAQRKRLQVTRARDGNRFWVDVTLPRDWQPGTRLPGIIWFYPREYTSQAQYEQSRYSTNINRFPEVPAVRPASAIPIWVTQGYAVIEPDAPIFGEQGRMNDNYTRDLRENLDAIVDAVVEAGYVDRARMGLGGHSYGAFSTVNAMTLVPYFRAGIAGSGMYNRTLTPFGFQSEQRDFFTAMNTYMDMSPFLRADKLAGALLLYHGMDDQNAGTAPISSVRLFHALQGLGKTAALYMYPYEDHSVATYESDLDQWARWIAWFEIHVRNAPAAPRITP